jgi:monomeric sarcosine oxidase
MHKSYDVAVIGAGVFGSWTAHHLQKAGARVILLDAYGPANSRASSGGESRIVRMGYGGDELYSRWSLRSLGLWREFFQEAGRRLFHKTGVLWLAHDGDPHTLRTLETLKRLGIPHERLSRPELEAHYPQMAFGPVSWTLFEPDSGVLMARRAVQALVEETIRRGADFRLEAVAPPTGNGRLTSVVTRGGDTVSAGQFVFACGPWLPKVFPDLLRHRIFPTRQTVFFFGVPPADRRFSPPAMPAWIDLGEQVYGIPDLESRGFKVALDRHGPPFDPDQGDRLVRQEEVAAVHEYMGRRFPAMKDAPLVEARVCQYENTSNGDFLIDRHPDRDNVWLVGGGSGHGFKHGPALGEYAATRVVEGGALESRFTLATKDTVQKRSVF